MIRISAGLWGAVLALAALSVVPPLPAQSGTASVSAPAVGPVVRSVGVAQPASAVLSNPPLQQASVRRDVAWMVVGGAALVVGSIVGGDGGTIIMVAGGVVGLVGLWRYLQR